MSNHTCYIELFPAGNGDAILIRMGDTLIMIDGGYPSTYRHYLKKRLIELNRQGFRINRLIVTHVDADHVSGVIPLIEENGDANNPSIIPIDQVWHNSYRHLQINEKKIGHFLSPPQVRLPINLHDDDADISSGDVSFKQGTTLGAVLLKGKYNWNGDFNEGAIVGDSLKKIQIENEIEFTLLTPTSDSLKRLGDYWLRNLRKIYAGEINEDSFFDDAYEKLLEMVEKPVLGGSGNVSGGSDLVKQNLDEWMSKTHEDTSVTNGSSISFVLEYAGKKMVFLGDAIPSHVLTQLEKKVAHDKLPIEADVLKLAHHGGFTNNSPELLNRIKATHYLFSSNGKRYNHPHLETIAWLLEMNKDHHKHLHFNYEQDRLHYLNNPNLKVKYNYEIGQVGKNGYIQIVI